MIFMQRPPGKHIGVLFLAVILILSGCAAARRENTGFASVQEQVASRIGSDLHWHENLLADEQVAEVIARMLEEPLTADSAAQIALLNNRRIQEFYQELEISRADLIQAGLLRNPVFDSSVLFPLDGGNTEVNLGIRFRLVEVFMIPMRKRVSESRFIEAEKRVASRVMDMAYRTRIAFFQAQADMRRIELLQEKVFAGELAYDFARRLRDAGNITELALHEQRGHYEMTRIALRRAETAGFRSRERLNRLMGLWGDQVHWKIQEPMPEATAGELESEGDLSNLESRVIEASLELDAVRRQILTAGHELGIQNVTALFPRIELGLEAEKNDDWMMGPALSFPIPLFDQGQARLSRSEAHLRRQQEHFTALAVDLRSKAREARERFESSRDIVAYYQKVILPLRTRIVNETHLQYNAMRLGPADLLLAKDQEIQAGLEYVQALEDYWISRTRIVQLLSGGMPRNGDGM
jgi:outer membrane protein, heavy metal efflux system